MGALKTPLSVLPLFEAATDMAAATDVARRAVRIDQGRRIMRDWASAKGLGSTEWAFNGRDELLTVRELQPESGTEVVRTGRDTHQVGTAGRTKVLLRAL